MVKKTESLKELQKQKEDIEILLSSLEEAYSEAGITEKNYKEVKNKNQKKLKELDKKIKKLESKAEKVAAKEEKEEKKAKKEPKKKPRTVGEMIEAEQGPIPVSKPEGEEAPAETPTPAVTETPPTTPGAAPTGVPGERTFNTDEIKAMLTRFIKEIRPAGLQVLPKVEKMQVRVEKMGAFLDAIKDDRSSRDETIRRLTEEIGELRSTMGGIDTKVSQNEIIVSEVNTAITDLKPQRFVKFLRKEDMQLRVHDSKLQRLEDLTSILVKRTTQIEKVLKKIGSLEKIADFGRDIAKRLVDIEEREKKIGRISDRIDSIFIELNKRLDEFMLYKAKQDTLDELSREMLKNIDDINTKIETFASKEDLDIMRETTESRISSAGGIGVSPEVKKLQQEKEEINGLLSILEEQFKKGNIKKNEYEKTKKVNMERLQSIEQKIQEGSQSTIVGVPAPVEETPTEPVTATQEAPIEGEAPAEPTPTEAPPEEKPMEAKPPEEEKPPEKEEKPKKTKEPAKKPAKKKSKKETMLEELEESYKKGEISKEAYEKTKKMIEGG